MSRARPLERASFVMGQNWFCAKPKISWLIKNRGMLPGCYTAHWNVFFNFKETMRIFARLIITYRKQVFYQAKQE